ncbi:hypothetical protein [Cellulosilyticum sp. I15G10I2]|uniref:hypothetical protein n=1 Tax=Cellulosilyticum sp. I15G10I2 TaxID=1892843 RepID=UPI00085C3079|nr:hypothetical protein [Cellulosilyticum sp. I15G10I2]
MCKINNLKFLITTSLSIIIIFTSVILNASELGSISPAEHKETINQFIGEIKDAQNQSLNIAQSALRDSIDTNQLQDQISIISNNLSSLNERIEDYADIVQGLNEQDRQVRLTFNFLNLVRSNLYTLTLLTRVTTDIQRLQLLDEYFRTRINTLDTLEILKDLLEKYTD